MKNIVFIISILLFFIQGIALGSIGVDIVNGDTLHYKRASKDEIRKSINKHEEVYFTYFQFIDSVDEKLRVEKINAFIDHKLSVKELEKQFTSIAALQEKQLDRLTIFKVNSELISYINETVFFSFTIDYDFKSRRDNWNKQELTTIYAYNIKSGQIYNQEQIESEVNKKALLKALRNKWKYIAKVAQLEEYAPLVNKSFSVGKSSKSKTNVFNEVDRVFKQIEWRNTSIHWSGLGVIIEFKDAFKGKTTGEDKNFVIHLTPSEVGNSFDNSKLFKGVKEFSKVKTNIKNYNGFYRGLGKVDERFQEHFIDLKQIPDKAIKSLEITRQEGEKGKVNNLGQWFFKNGKLIGKKRLKYEAKSDSIIWDNSRITSIHYQKSQRGKPMSGSFFTKYWNGKNNIQNQSSIGSAFKVQDYVYVGNEVLSIVYNVMFAHTNMYEKRKVIQKGGIWVGQTDLITSKQEVYSFNKKGQPEIKGEQIFVYNTHGQLIQQLSSRDRSQLFTYDEEGRLKTVMNDSRSSSLHTYFYKEQSKLPYQLIISKEGLVYDQIYNFIWK